MPENNGEVVNNSFDGIIKEWPQEKSLSMYAQMPKDIDKYDFIRQMACDLFKNQFLQNPRPQAEECISYASAMYNALKSKGLFK